MFGVQLYKNNARALLSRILSILNLDWLQHAHSVRGVYEYIVMDIPKYIHYNKQQQMCLKLTDFIALYPCYTYVMQHMGGGGLCSVGFLDVDEINQKIFKKPIEIFAFFSIVTFQSLDQFWWWRCHFKAEKKFWYIKYKIQNWLYLPSIPLWCAASQLCYLKSIQHLVGKSSPFQETFTTLTYITYWWLPFV